MQLTKDERKRIRLEEKERMAARSPWSGFGLVLFIFALSMLGGFFLAGGYHAIRVIP